MDGKTDLFPADELPWNLGELGMIVKADLVIPGVYDAVLEMPETGVLVEAYVVFRDTAEISETAKKYGKAIAAYSEMLAYWEDEVGDSRYIIGYEIFRYKIIHHLPLPEGETIGDIAAVGAEMYPEYFGYYPIPFLTPWGCTTRNKVIANGVYWLETEQCQRGLAVAYPKYDDLSDRARELAEQMDIDSVSGYLFFKEPDSCVPLFELAFLGHDEQPFGAIDRAALMNAIYQLHPEYATSHNANEQVGLNDGIGLLLRTMGNDVELQSSSERFISLTAGVGTDFITF